MPGNRRAGPRRQGPVRWGIRAIWRKLDCLKPSLQKVQCHARRKDVWNRRRPLLQGDQIPAAILRGAGAMPCQGIKGDERDA